MNTDVGAELRSRLRARSGSATGCHRQVIHYRPPCGARNFLLAAASQYFDRCTFRAQPSSAAGGGRLSERYLHQFRLAASEVSARCRLAVPEISLLATASRNFDRCTFHALPSSAAGGGRLSDCHLHKFSIAASEVSARCRLAVPEISCSLPLREISTAARFAPCLLPPQAAARRKTPFESPSYQKRKALLRSAFLFWQPNRDSNPNIQSQSLLCYRYTIRLYLLLAENSISVCSPVVNSFLQFSKNYA